MTTAQRTESEDRKQLSPMNAEPYTDPITGEEHFNFEAWWQSRRKWAGVPLETSRKWWKNIKKPRRRYEGSKGKKVEYAEFGDGVKLDYIQSRIQQYVPKYHALMVKTERAKHWRERVERGEGVVVYDFDGPRLPDGTHTCLEVTVDLLREKLYDPRHPFGHGYIVAAELAGIPLEAYCY